MPGIEAHCTAWAKCTAMQLWWKMDKRRFNHEDMDRFLNDVFDPMDLQYITISRWSKSKGMAVLKQKSIVFDLDSV